jgi:hypothetical protein
MNRNPAAPIRPPLMAGFFMRGRMGGMASPLRTFLQDIYSIFHDQLPWSYSAFTLLAIAVPFVCIAIGAASRKR